MSKLVLGGVAAAALAVVAPVAHASADPGAGNVGTAVQVVIHKAFQPTSDADQCTGAGTLAAVRRGSSVILSEPAATADAPKVAIGQFFRSRMKDGTCQVLYITSAPVMPAFNVQFASPASELSPTFGPSSAEPVTDQPGIAQLVRVDMEFDPQA